MGVETGDFGFLCFINKRNRWNKDTKLTLGEKGRFSGSTKKLSESEN